MKNLITAEELTENIALAVKQINQVAGQLNKYVTSEDYKNSLESLVSGFNRFSQQLNQQFAERAKK